MSEEIITSYCNLLQKKYLTKKDIDQILVLEKKYLDLKNEELIDIEIQKQYIKMNTIFLKKIYPIITDNEKIVVSNYLKSFPIDSYLNELKIQEYLNQFSGYKFSKIKNIVFERNKFSSKMNYKNYYDFSCQKENINNEKLVKIKEVRKLAKNYLAKIYEKSHITHLEIEFNKILPELLEYKNNLLNSDKQVNIKFEKTREKWFLKYYPYKDEYHIYQKIKCNENDIINFAHEIGHVYHISNSKDKIINLLYLNYGISEFFSSISEVLCIQFFNSFEIKKRHIQKMLKIILSSLVVDEFLEFLYTKVEINEEELNNKWKKVNEEYGLKSYGDWKEVFIIRGNHENVICYAVAYLLVLGSYEKINKKTLSSFLLDSKIMNIDELLIKYFGRIDDENLYINLSKYCEEWLDENGNNLSKTR